MSVLEPRIIGYGRPMKDKSEEQFLEKSVIQLSPEKLLIVVQLTKGLRLVYG